jgi:glycosyltransferase involved in cell wall biosynthesis
MTGYKGDRPDGISIGFDAKRAFFNYSGLGNYSRNLLSALARYYPENYYYLFTPKTKNRIILPDEEKFRLISPGKFLSKMASRLWRTKYMVNDFKGQSLQIYHGLSQELPSGIEKSGVKSVVTVHDLIFMRFPGYYNRIDSKIYTRKLINSCLVSDRVVAMSKQTRDDLVEFLGIPRGKISVIYQGCNAWFWNYDRQNSGQDIRTKYNLPERYLLFVSTIEERKNLLGVLKAMNILKIDIPLVVIGRKSDPYFKNVASYITASKLRSVIFPGGIINTELPAIYRNAECLVYPSFFEGFGIPVLEALVSGTPVITSKGGCFAESGGPGSLYVDPGNPEEIGEAILKVINDKGLRQKMIAAGKDYASGFKDETIAREYMDLYRSLLS